MCYQLHPNYPKSKLAYTKYSVIARDSKTLTKLIAAENQKNDKKRRTQVGILLGYPKTAVKAFGEYKVIDVRTLPSSILKKPEMKFLHFRLSKHWKTELRYVKRRAEIIKKTSPELYKQIAKKSLKKFRKGSAFAKELRLTIQPRLVS